MVLEPQKGDDVGPSADGKTKLTFLGCEMTKQRREIRTGQWAETIEYNISKQLKRALAKYEEAVYSATGLIPEYTKARTPFLEEETKHSPHRAPYEGGDFVECPNCLDTIPKSVADERTFKEGTQRKVNNIWEMDVFKETGLTRRDCK